MCESFFATLECELIDRTTFRTRSEARLAVFDCIEAFYNPRRRHSALGYASPHHYEARLSTPAKAAAQPRPAPPRQDAHDLAVSRPRKRVNSTHRG